MKKYAKLGFSFSPHLIILGFILLLAAWLRFRGILLGYFAFTFDPGRDLLVVRDLVVNHKITLIGPFSGLSGVFYGPWWYWILALPFFVSGGDPTGIAIFVALANLFVPLGLYLLGKKMGSPRAGLLGAMTGTLSPVLIGYSSQIWNPNLVPPLTMAAVLLLYKLQSLPGKNKTISNALLIWLGLGIVMGLTVNFQISFGMAFLFSLVPWFIYMFVTRQHARLGLLCFCGGIILMFLPLVAFDLRHNFLETKSILAYLHDRPVRSYNYNALPLTDKAANRWGNMQRLLTETFGQNILALVATGVVTLGLFFSLRQKNKDNESNEKNLAKEFLPWLIVSVVFIFIFFMLYSDTVWDYYLAGLPVIYLSLVTTSFVLILGRMEQVMQRLVFVASLVVVIVFLFPFNRIPDWLGWDKNPWLGDASVFRNQLAIVDYIYQDAGDSELNTMVYTPPIYDYHYQYLFLWYGQKKYGRVPGHERQGNLYLIMEPENNKPWLWEGWIKTVVKDPGHMASRKEFPGGVVVEKRVID